MRHVQHHSAVVASELDPGAPPRAEAGFAWLPSRATAVAVAGAGKGEMGIYADAEFEATTLLGGMVGLLADPGEVEEAHHGNQGAFDAGRIAGASLRGRATDDRQRLRLLADDLEEFWRSAHDELHRPPPPRSVHVGGVEYLVRDEPHVPFRAADRAFRKVEVACLRFEDDQLEFSQLGGFALYRWSPDRPLESLVPVGMLGHPSCPWSGGAALARQSAVVLQAMSLRRDGGLSRPDDPYREPLRARVPCAPGDLLLLLSSSTYAWMDPADLLRGARPDSVDATVDRTTAALHAARGRHGKAFVVAAFAPGDHP